MAAEGLDLADSKRIRISSLFEFTTMPTHGQNDTTNVIASSVRTLLNEQQAAYSHLQATVKHIQNVAAVPERLVDELQNKGLTSEAYKVQEVINDWYHENIKKRQ